MTNPLEDFNEVFCDQCMDKVVSGSIAPITLDQRVKMVPSGNKNQKKAFMCPVCHQEKFFEFRNNRIQKITSAVYEGGCLVFFVIGLILPFAGAITLISI